MSKVNDTGNVKGRLRPLKDYIVFEVLLVEREGFRVLSSARDLYVYENSPFLTLARVS